MDNIFTLDDIQEVIEENLDLTWVDRIIYNPLNKYYHTATEYDLEKMPNRQTYVYLRDKRNSCYLAVINFNDDRFIIRMNGTKVDVSEHWKELLDKHIVSPQSK